jgi:hypothetical protein
MALRQIAFGTSVEEVLRGPGKSDQPSRKILIWQVWRGCPTLDHDVGRSVRLIAQIALRSAEQFRREIGGLLLIVLCGRISL